MKGVRSPRDRQHEILCLPIIKDQNKYISYVGYTNDLTNRINMHNTSKGAKFTRGKKWKLVYYKSYTSKKTAMQEEYKLKKNYYLRQKIKQNYIN